MTTHKDTIRQASLFTMNGLADPRLMPGYVAPKAKRQASLTPFFLFSIIWRKLSLR